ncbi:hypothetical protein A2Z33_03050 [Candidatus Gottesmanbacteria bacterium RBG_16_52_11]|uniref:DUF5652 domain-containing protein n=1 Tax=Candidatus Gottesmanbacteria bacterium RBG_16_52_11 TaxID=1798374 RepID=A0A1F5YVG9_9BACT|nr:MAG: hypothetical protein A2Z33_03050 [Candidatus Gottesmanbacteria bacterium RBG_16_52_11]
MFNPMVIGNAIRNPVIITVLALWSLVWTALSLWHAARRGEKRWFVWFLLVHTAGIVEIAYLYFVVGITKHPRNERVRRPA